MELLTSLGVNSTIWAQLIIFMGVYFVLSKTVFGPYLEALKKREESTVGGEESAERILEEVTSLKKEFEEKAKKLSSEQMVLYNQAREGAQKKHDRAISQAREEAEDVIEGVRQKIKKNIEQVRKEMFSEIPAVSKNIVGKLVGGGS